MIAGAELRARLRARRLFNFCFARRLVARVTLLAGAPQAESAAFVCLSVCLSVRRLAVEPKGEEEDGEKYRISAGFNFRASLSRVELSRVKSSRVVSGTIWRGAADMCAVSRANAINK